MLARSLRLTTIGTLALAIAWAWGCWQAGRPVFAFVGALAIVGAQTMVLATEFVLLHRVHGEDPTPRATLVQLLRAWWKESRHMYAVFWWRQPFRSERWPDTLPEAARGRRGVVLIHGFVCNRGVWNRWLERLTQLGVPMVAVSLEPVFGPIDGYAAAVDAAIGRVERCTGLPPIVVAHSMGGLVLRRWWANPGNAGRVQRALTIGTPHRGTWLARFGTTLAARQMRVGSQWLQALAQDEPPERADKLICFYGHCDNIVFPPGSAALPGADNRHLDGVAHLCMVDHPEPWNVLQRLLSEDGALASPAGPPPVPVTPAP